MFIHTKVIVSKRVFGEEVPDSYEEVPLSVRISQIAAFYKRVEEEGEYGKCEPRRTTLVLQDGTEFYIPISYEEVARIVTNGEAPPDDGGILQSQPTPTNPVDLVPGI